MKQPISIQINIPQPCHEDWNSMTPQAKGRFCDACQKCVVDFTGYSDEELYKYFASGKHQNVCGKFNVWQLQRHVKSQPVRQNKFRRWFISLSFAFLLSELLSTQAKAQEPTNTEIKKKDNRKNGGSILGTITDSSNMPAANVTVIVRQGKTEISRSYTDNDGLYLIKGIDAGYYNVIISKVGHKNSMVTDVLIEPKKPTELNVQMQKTTENDESISITRYTQPIVDHYGQTKITLGQADAGNGFYLKDGILYDNDGNKIRRVKNNIFRNLWDRIF